MFTGVSWDNRESLKACLMARLKVILLLVVIMLFSLVLFPFLKKYYASTVNYKSLYQVVLNNYQSAIEEYATGLPLKATTGDVNLKVLQSPSRNPSYQYMDLEGDGIDELIIAFHDGSDEIEVLAAYTVAFYGLKKLPADLIHLSNDDTRQGHWTAFDVSDLVSMSVDDLVKGDFSSIKGQWESKDGQQLEFSATGLLTVNHQAATDHLSDLIGNQIFLGDHVLIPESFAVNDAVKGRATGFVVAENRLSIEDLYFIPRGIAYSSSDASRDRIVTVANQAVFYREKEQ